MGSGRAEDISDVKTAQRPNDSQNDRTLLLLSISTTTDRNLVSIYQPRVFRLTAPQSASFRIERCFAITKGGNLLTEHLLFECTFSLRTTLSGCRRVAQAMVRHLQAPDDFTHRRPTQQKTDSIVKRLEYTKGRPTDSNVGIEPPDQPFECQSLLWVQ